MRILCVDDDGLVLSVTADLLRELGHDVVEAVGGTNAADVLLSSSPIDLLVTDIHMPGGPGGPEVAALARHARPDLPIIYFSALSHSLPPGVAGTVLRKPCTLGEFEQAIDRALLPPPGRSAGTH